MRSAPALATAATVVASITAGLVAAPQPAGAETTIEVTTPADGRYQPGSTTPLLVTIEADRAISGTLTATFDGIFGGSQRVEVPGGSAKEVVFIIATPAWTTSGQVSFNGDNSDDDKTARLNLSSAGPDELVAVMPGVVGGNEVPATATLAIEVGVARLYPFDPALLSAGAEVLSVFNQVITTAGDLQELRPEQLEAVRSWVGTAGGTLVIDEKPGTPMPFELEPDPRATGSEELVAFGVGHVVYTNGRASSGTYDKLLRPTPTRSPDELPFGGGMMGSVPTTILLASDAGVRIPAIGSIVGLLILYGLVAGPLLWFVLKRSRRETMLWTALPALALVTTFGLYGVGRALRDETSSAHATVVADLPTTRIVSTQVLVTSPNGGTEGIKLADKWRPLSTVSDEMFFGPQAATSFGRQQHLDGDLLVTDLPSGGVGVVSAETAQPAAEPSWRFDLKAEDDSLVGTITNLTEVPLEEIYVTSGQGFDRVASLGPGQSADIALKGTNSPIVNRDKLMERLQGGDVFSPNDGPVNAGVLINWLSRRPGLRAPGYILAVGWTRDRNGPLPTSRGQSVTKGRTAFLTAQRVASTALSSATSRLEVLRGNSTRVEDDLQPGACADLASTIRITPGASIEGQEPVIDFTTRAVAALDLWDGAAWQPAGLSEATPGQVILGVPDTAFKDGSLYLRMKLDCNFWNLADPFPQLRPAAVDDEVLQIGALVPVAAASEAPGA